MCDTPGLHKTGYLFDRDAEMIAVVINAVTNEHISAHSTERLGKEIYIWLKKPPDEQEWEEHLQNDII